MTSCQDGLDCYTAIAWWQLDCQWGGWSKYKSGLPRVLLDYGITWPVGISNVFRMSLTVPLHSPTDRQMPVVWAVQGDCETVYGRLSDLMDYQTSWWISPPLSVMAVVIWTRWSQWNHRATDFPAYIYHMMLLITVRYVRCVLSLCGVLVKFNEISVVIADDLVLIWCLFTIDVYFGVTLNKVLEQTVGFPL